MCYQGSFGWFGWIEQGWGGGVVWWASGPGRQVETGAAGLTWSWLQQSARHEDCRRSRLPGNPAGRIRHQGESGWSQNIVMRKDTKQLFVEIKTFLLCFS